jgi:hypothetical protein
MPSAQWYWNRLRRMSPPEIVHRAFRKLQTMNEARTAASGLLMSARSEGSGMGLPPIPPIEVATGPYLQAGDAAMQGRGSVLGLVNARFGPQFGWNRDPRTGTLAPLMFGPGLDYRDEAVAGDIKYLWEPNRHLHFPALAQAFVLSGEARYARAIGEHIASWIEQCPYPRGPNWSSALETGIRLINWSVTWRLLGGTDSMRQLAAEHGIPIDAWVRSIGEHLHFTANHYSGFSSANNHLIGEAAGVYIGCLTWPLWPHQRRWRAKARQILISECERQNFPDGVNREQATSYQQFVFDFLVLAAIAGGQAADPFPVTYWQRLERMVGFIAALSTNGKVPQIGDSDDALVVALAPDAADAPFRSMLALGARLFDRHDWELAAGGIVDRTLWMLSGVPADIAGLKSQPQGIAVKPVETFPDGGYHILRTPGGPTPAVKVLFDTGPLGYLSIAAHGHADALALVLWLDGREFLIDAGTYAYHTDKHWRDYFRGTRAHNTLAVDGCDQSESGGNFMWLRHAHTRHLKTDENGAYLRVSGTHDGYRRLPDSVRHIREVSLAKNGESLTVTDELHCRKSHTVEIFWHFAEDCQVEAAGPIVRACRDGRWLELSTEKQKIDTMILSGTDNPIGGWVSRRFGEKVPCTTVVWRFQCEGNTTLPSRLRFG